MKLLGTYGGHDLVIIDDNNYGIGKMVESPAKGKKPLTHTLAKGKYFNRLDHAVRRLAELRANEDCTNLEDWLTRYAVYVSEMTP